MEVAKDVESSHRRFELRSQTESEYFLVRQCRLGARPTRLFYCSELLFGSEKIKGEHVK